MAETTARFVAELRKKKQSVVVSLELIKFMLRKIKDDFSNPKFKCIKKANPKFLESVGRFPAGMRLMKTLGFCENSSTVFFPESLPKSVVQMKIVEFDIAAASYLG